jgi:hypothetical protein
MGIERQITSLRIAYNMSWSCAYCGGIVLHSALEGTEGN